MLIFDIDECESRLGYVFKDKMLLRQCFTHSSYANEHGCKDNELLEFFGDSIIEFAVTEYLFKNRYGDEGKLTDERAKIVSKKPLLEATKNLGLMEFVLLGNGLSKQKKLDEKLFSSVYEAVVAGIYIDSGIKEAKKFIKDTLITVFEKSEKKKIEKKKEQKPLTNVKSSLQEYVQKSKIGSVAYELLWKKGPDHLPIFRCAVLLNGERIAEGEGNNKKVAESEAAKKALERLKTRR